MSCEAVQEELTERLLTPGAPGPEHWDPALRTHVQACTACAGHVQFLRALTTSLASAGAAALAPAHIAQSRARAVRALRAHRPSRAFGRELVGAVVVLALGLPLAVAQAWLIAQGAAALLEPLLPEAVLIALGVFYAGTFLLMVGTLYAFVPLWVAAVRRARMEVP
ncbi:hypothetical protein KJ059_03965 [Myxococcota bacterium]|nr:hypothetical protein [Myxococcota bacterium]MCZ7619265.1 hypothetical protein [Myxococcota bacterium]